MKQNATAQKAQETNSTLTIVEKETSEKNAKVINFQSNAVDTPSEEVKTELRAEQPKEEPKEVQEVKPIQSIDEIKRKSEVLSRLSAKWDNLNEKLRRIENFAISHDGDTANVIVKDAQGEIFDSNSPKTIGKLIEFWKVEFSNVIAEVEKEMREIA